MLGVDRCGLGHMPEGEGEERVAGEDRGRFVEGLVDGGLAAAEVVVVHRGQVVVDQRVAVEELDRETGGKGARGADVEHRRRLAHEQRPEALAAAERGMAHRGDQPLGRLARTVRGEVVEHDLEAVLDGIGALGALAFEVHDASKSFAFVLTLSRDQEEAMATGEMLRTLALKLEGTAEAPHFDRLAFKARRIYVTLAADGKTANFFFTPEEQEMKCAIYPEAFMPLDNKWGAQGWTRAILAKLLEGGAAGGAGDGVRAHWEPAKLGPEAGP